jgi:excisionase family DNA binding protein
MGRAFLHSWYPDTTPLTEEGSMGELDAVQARLRRLVQAGDPDGTVTLRWLAQQIGEPIPGEAVAEEPARDLTVEEVAEHFRRAPSTVRGWLLRGDLRGYKLNGRDWRVPKSAVGEYEQRQREPGLGDAEAVDLSAWRRI